MYKFENTCSDQMISSLDVPVTSPKYLIDNLQPLSIFDELFLFENNFRDAAALAAKTAKKQEQKAAGEEPKK